MDILVNQELRMKNVLSFRKKLSAVALQQETERIGRFIENGGFNKTGPTASVTFAVEEENGEQIFDIEVLIPLEQPFTPPDGCVCKSEFRLLNAVFIRHTGDPARLQESCDKLTAYIQEHELQPITCGYNVTVQEPKTSADIDQMIVDVYIGVNPNIL